MAAKGCLIGEKVRDERCRYLSVIYGAEGSIVSFLKAVKRRSLWKCKTSIVTQWCFVNNEFQEQKYLFGSAINNKTQATTGFPRLIYILTIYYLYILNLLSLLTNHYYYDFLPDKMWIALSISLSEEARESFRKVPSFFLSRGGLLNCYEAWRIYEVRGEGGWFLRVFLFGWSWYHALPENSKMSNPTKMLYFK